MDRAARSRQKAFSWTPLTQSGVPSSPALEARDRTKACYSRSPAGLLPRLWVEGQSLSVPPAPGTPTTHPPGAMSGPAGCHTLYLSSVSVETLSGGLAVQKAISATLEQDVLPTPTVVHFRVTEQGITLTDIQRK